MKILLAICCACVYLGADTLYFMPYQANEAVNRLIKEIKNAKKEVKIAIYSFTNREISKAIRDSAKNGVQYKIIFDEKSNIKDTRSSIGYLAKLKNIQTCTLKGRISANGQYYGIMHTKLAIIDGETIIFGSANWSKSAFEINYEMMLVSQNKSYITPALKYFDEIYKNCKSY